ncbi:Ku protein [Kitasatospora sp. NPDC057542]|uniref:Ku protein n=1 Tax=Kitasatospora sp. NPDC057542 TaxID=3346162 RepID=UPI00367BE02A
MYVANTPREPARNRHRPYALLRQALLDADEVAVVRTMLRTRETLAVLRVREDTGTPHLAVARRDPLPRGDRPGRGRVAGEGARAGPRGCTPWRVGTRAGISGGGGRWRGMRRCSRKWWRSRGRCWIR